MGRFSNPWPLDVYHSSCRTLIEGGLLVRPARDEKGRVSVKVLGGVQQQGAPSAGNATADSLAI